MGYPEIKDTGREITAVKLLVHPAHSPDLAHSDFYLFLQLKETSETSGRPEVSRRRRGEKGSHRAVACVVLWHRNTKTLTQAKQML
jgi:hypothetical protein